MKNLIKFSVFLFSTLLVGCFADTSDPEMPEIVIKAVADNYSVNENNTLTIEISDILKNDEIEKSVEVTFNCENISSQAGNITIGEKSITYTPKKDFVGTDNFNYTICSKKVADACSSAKITIEVNKEDEPNPQPNPNGFNIPEELKEYYKDLTYTTDATQLKEKLKSIISDYDNKGYGKRHKYLYKADADLENADSVVLIYSGEKRYWKEYMSGENSYNPQTFNTEHVYPQSLLKKQNKREAIGDLHHLRSCDSHINSKRGNRPFTDGSGEYKSISGKWFPGDEWKGDVARMVLYLNVMHDLSFDAVGTKELFLKWNVEDPVSDFEKQRNDEIQKGQENRNPFIDNPYLATMIYGGEAAENKWE